MFGAHPALPTSTRTMVLSKACTIAALMGAYLLSSVTVSIGQDALPSGSCFDCAKNFTNKGEVYRLADQVGESPFLQCL